MYCKNYYFYVNDIHGLFAKRSRIVGDCMNKSNKRQLGIITILNRDKFVKVWQLSEFTLVELVGYEDVEARSPTSFSLWVVHRM